jgi:hypothetical protein
VAGARVPAAPLSLLPSPYSLRLRTLPASQSHPPDCRCVTPAISCRVTLNTSYGCVSPTPECCARDKTCDQARGRQYAVLHNIQLRPGHAVLHNIQLRPGQASTHVTKLSMHQASVLPAGVACTSVTRISYTISLSHYPRHRLRFGGRGRRWRTDTVTLHAADRRFCLPVSVQRFPWATMSSMRNDPDRPSSTSLAGSLLLLVTAASGLLPIRGEVGLGFGIHLFLVLLPSRCQD